MSDVAVFLAFRRLRERLTRRRSSAAEIAADAEGLVVVVAGYDDVESCSVALERGAASVPRWSAHRQALVRHPMVVPANTVAKISAVCAQEGYTQAGGGQPPPAAALGELGVDEVLLILVRSELLDALHCSQERSRMAGLAQRYGGRTLGWDALQPDTDAEPAR